MIKLTKLFMINPAQIQITGVKCNYFNIKSIISVFEWKLIVLTVDSVKKEGAFYEFIKRKELKHYIKPSSKDEVEITVIVTIDLLLCALDELVNEYPENIFISNIFTDTDIDMLFQSSFENLVIKGYSDFSILLSLDEKSVLILMNKLLISPKDAFNKLKAMKFK